MQMYQAACLALAASCLTGAAPAEAPSVRIQKSTGLTFSVLESKIRRSIISTDTPYGFKVKGVDAGSPAARSGLKRGDVVLEWNGKPLRKVVELARWLDADPSGAAVTVKISRLERGKKRRLFRMRSPWVESEVSLSPRKRA